ncbi:MAG: hypothetical protein BRD57_01335, partial [Proteobacteria bacterium SW_6_67_9]
MIGLLQRVTQASVTVADEPVAEIGRGLLVLVGVERGDNEASARRLAQRLLGYRVFPDEAGRMNVAVLVSRSLPRVTEQRVGRMLLTGQLEGAEHVGGLGVLVVRFHRLLKLLRDVGLGTNEREFGAGMVEELRGLSADPLAPTEALAKVGGVVGAPLGGQPLALWRLGLGVAHLEHQARLLGNVERLLHLTALGGQLQVVEQAHLVVIAGDRIDTLAGRAIGGQGAAT